MLVLRKAPAVAADRISGFTFMKITITSRAVPKLSYEELERENGRLALKADRLHCDNMALLEILKPLMEYAEWERLEQLYWMAPLTETVQ